MSLQEAAYDALEARLGHRFADRALLELALTHRSLAREGQVAHNQRLEFLGDAVLGVMIAELLYKLFPEANEGDLSKRLVSLVNGQHLARIAREMELGDMLHMSANEEEQGGRTNDSHLEDACEALLGALYLDGGLDAVRPVIARYWESSAQTLTAAPKDAKTGLQEWAQGRGLPLPEYTLVSSDGPAHAPHFVVQVRVQGHAPVRGEAGTKRAAERLAAEVLLNKLS